MTSKSRLKSNFRSGIRVVSTASKLAIASSSWPLRGVDLAGQPVDDPGGGGLLVRRGLLQGGEGVGDPAFPLIDPRQVDPAVGPAQLGDLPEDLLGLLQLALLAALGRPLEQQADAVVVPALPDVLDRRGLVVDGRPALDREAGPGRWPSR